MNGISQVGWADVRKPIVQAAWTKKSLKEHQYAGWISGSASTGYPTAQDLVECFGLVDAHSLIHPTIQLNLGWSL